MLIYLKLFEVLFPVFFVVGIGYYLGKNPIIGPTITLPIEHINAFLKENTLNLVRAIPNDIKIKKIVAYIKSIVVFY